MSCAALLDRADPSRPWGLGRLLPLISKNRACPLEEGDPAGTAQGKLI